MKSISEFPVGEALAPAIERWLYRYKQISVKTATFERLLVSHKAMLSHRIAFIRLMDLTTSDLQEYINEMIDAGYAYTTIKKQYNLISAFVRFLLGEGVGIRPIHLNATLPAPDKTHKKRKESNAYNKAEQVRLWKAAETENTAGSIAMRLMIDTGMRIGEVLALSWADILWERRAVSIHATLVNPQGQKKSFVQDSAKSQASKRIIPLSGRVMDLLEPLFDGQSGLIFQSARDPTVSVGYNAIRMQIQSICRAANVEYRGLHVFRHTFATNCYYKGCDVKILSKLLGHSSVTVTYNTYIHLYGDALEEMRSIVG